MKINIDLKKVGKTLGNATLEGCKIAVPILIVGVVRKYFPEANVAYSNGSFSMGNTKMNMNLLPDDLTYGDAVAAISNSTMGSYEKGKAIERVRRDESSEYYKAIYSIAKSDMGSYERQKAILDSVKRFLPIPEEYDYFDSQLVMHINSTFMILNQLGVGPTRGFKITGKEDLWSDFLQDNIQLEGVKSYMCMKVKLLFDPPQNSSVTESYKAMCNEFEWRCREQVESN